MDIVRTFEAMARLAQRRARGPSERQPSGARPARAVRLDVLRRPSRTRGDRGR